MIAAGLLLLAPAVAVRPPAEIEFRATVHAEAFTSAWVMPGYHLVVWDEGGSAHPALLRTKASDVEVLNALESLGARPGDNVPTAAWDERRDRSNPAADTVVRGPAVEILLRLPGRNALVPIRDVLSDPGGRGIDMRFGGHRANIARSKSGCIACLYSCPGSKVGNAAYTVRDYVDGVARFGVKPGVLPPDGTEVGVVLRLLPEPRN